MTAERLPSSQPMTAGGAVFDLHPDGLSGDYMARAARPLTMIIIVSGSAFAVVSVLGFLGPLNAFWNGRVPEAIGLGAGLFMIVLGAVLGRVLRSHTSVKVSVGPEGIAFTQATGALVRVPWHDSTLEVRVTEFLGDAEAVFPKGDERRIRPQWISIQRTGRKIGPVWTVAPRAAITEILRVASDAGAKTRVESEELYWVKLHSGVPVLKSRTVAEGVPGYQANTRVTIYCG